MMAHQGQRVVSIFEVPADLARPWRNRRLIFESETLDTVVEEINRYRPGHVFLSDRALVDYRVSGVFRIDRIDQVLAVIDKTLPVKSLAMGKRLVFLY